MQYVRLELHQSSSESTIIYGNISNKSTFEKKTEYGIKSGQSTQM